MTEDRQIVTAEDLERIGLPVLDASALKALNRALIWDQGTWFFNRDIWDAGHTRGAPTTTRNIYDSCRRLLSAAKTLRNEFSGTRSPKFFVTEVRDQLRERGHDPSYIADLLDDICEVTGTAADNCFLHNRFVSRQRHPNTELIESVGMSIARILGGTKRILPRLNTHRENGTYHSLELDLAVVALRRLGLNVDAQEVGSVWKTLRRSGPKGAQKHYPLTFPK